MTEPLMWPCEMPIPNNLYPGMIVEHEDGNRGMVKARFERGDTVRMPLPGMVVAGDVEVWKQPGISTITSNQDRKWRIVEPQDYTTEERVRVAAFHFEPLSERDPAARCLKALDSIEHDYSPDLPARVREVLGNIKAMLTEYVESGPADDDSIGWHLLAALLPMDELAEAESWDWPESVDLAVRVARKLDATLNTEASVAS